MLCSLNTSDTYELQKIFVAFLSLTDLCKCISIIVFLGIPREISHIHHCVDFICVCRAARTSQLLSLGGKTYHEIAVVAAFLCYTPRCFWLYSKPNLFFAYLSRARLVSWVRSLAEHFYLPLTAVADAVGLVGEQLREGSQ